MRDISDEPGWSLASAIPDGSSKMFNGSRRCRRREFAQGVFVPSHELENSNWFELE